MSPRSSVTVYASPAVRRWRSSASQGRLGQAARVGQAGGPGEPEHRGSGLGGRRRAGPATDALETFTQLGRDRRLELGQRVADDPGSMAVVVGPARVAWRSQNAATAARSTSTSERSAHASAFCTSGSRSPMSSSRIARPARDGRLAAPAAGRRTGSWRWSSRRAGAPSATARRRAARARPTGRARRGCRGRTGGPACRR